MKKKVIAAGHICIDITPTIGAKGAANIQDVLIPGSLMNVGKADIHTGGAVANTGLAMKILGADVLPAGKIGDDAFGDLVYSLMDGYHAADGLIRKEGESTSYSVVLAVPGIDRIFLHHPGANDTFCADDISNEMLEGACLFHFGYPPQMKRIYENNGDELVRLFQKVKDSGCVTSLDLAAVDPDSPAAAADWNRILERVLPLTDIFVPSVEELMFMLDRDQFDILRNRAGGGDFCSALDIEKEVVPLADRCLEMGAGIVMIKCGVPGLYLKTAGRSRLDKLPEAFGLDTRLWEHRSLFETSYRPDRVLSGTGAGDTSIAAFLMAVLSGYGPDECACFAAAEGASCVAAYDALGGIKSLPELEQKIRSGWEKIK